MCVLFHLYYLLISMRTIKREYPLILHQFMIILPMFYLPLFVSIRRLIVKIIYASTREYAIVSDNSCTLIPLIALALNIFSYLLSLILKILLTHPPHHNPFLNILNHTQIILFSPYTLFLFIIVFAEQFTSCFIICSYMSCWILLSVNLIWTTPL
jgi:hypothetical protein